MPGPSAQPAVPRLPRAQRWQVWSALLAAAAASAFLAVPALEGAPARLIEGCARWLVLAGILELLSGAGFVVFFKLVFAGGVSWRRSGPAALRALAATTLLPGGGLVGPTVGAWSTTSERPTLAQLTRRTATFVLLTNVPSAIALAVLGVMLWLGLASGPGQAGLTILPALLAAAFLAIAWRWSRVADRRRSRRHPESGAGSLARPLRALRDGLIEAHDLVVAGNWKLGGALAYYAFDNAVLWAAFHAYGRVPPAGVVVMGYLVGSLAGALPLPAGLGALDGGLIGALVLYGVPPARAAAAVLLYRGVSISVPAILGAIGCAADSVSRLPHRGGREGSIGETRPPARTYDAAGLTS